MSDAIGYGLPATIGSAALYGVAPLVQAMAARRERAGRGLGLGLLARLARRPLWLLGLAVETAAFLLEVYALSVAPVAMVGPVMALDMIVFTLLAGRALRERLSRRGRAAIVLMVTGVGLLAYAFERHGDVGSMASTKQLLLFLSAGLAFALAAALGANQAATRGRVATAAFGFGVAAGVAYAIATLATRQFGLALDERRPDGAFVGSYLVDLLRTPAPYLLIVFSVLAMSLEQRGLQGPAAVVAFPVTSGVSAFLPAVLGLTLFDEPAPTGWHFVAFVAALAFIATGIASLGRDRAAAGTAQESGASAGPGAGAADRPEPSPARPTDGSSAADSPESGPVAPVGRSRALRDSDASPGYRSTRGSAEREGGPSA